jgi:hypothetical protein
MRPAASECIRQSLARWSRQQVPADALHQYILLYAAVSCYSLYELLASLTALQAAAATVAAALSQMPHTYVLHCTQ